MKKQNKLFKLFNVLFLSFFAFSSCQIGLGNAIDLEAPVVELTSHKDSDYVGQNFRLAGTAFDNEKIKKLSIDFDEADIHFVLENNVWKKKTSYTADWVTLSTEEGTCALVDKTISWNVLVTTSDAKVGTGSTYNFTIIVEDEIGNSDKSSKLEGSLVVDENIPNISINSPELFTTYEKIQSEYPKFVLNDGNVIAQLFNGTLVLNGRQDAAASFKEFRIEFDNGITDSKIVDSSNYDVPVSTVSTECISNTYPFDRSVVYYSKTLKTGQDNISDLRTWNIQVKPEDWISAEKNKELATGKHIIRVVATGISSSDTWQRKTLGFFTWYPEADKPWITLYSGTTSLETVSTDQTYPSTKIFGLVQDDDGIKSLTYSLAKQNSDKTFTNIKTNEALTLSEEDSKNSQWYIDSPAESAVYKLSVTVTDMYNNTASLDRYFNVLDVQPPKISLSTPAEGSNVFSYAGSSIPLSGTVSDDGIIKTLKVAYLYPEKSLENKIKFINHAEPDWNKSSDSEGNLIFDISLPEPSFDNTTKIFTYNFTKNLDLFNDLKISSEKPLKTQDFVILAVDSAGGATVYPFAISGDSESPKINFTKFERYNVQNQLTKTYSLPSELTLGVIKTGDYAKIYGTWEDDSTTHWKKYEKINNIDFSWGENSKFSEFKMESNGTWSVKVESLPSVSTSLVAKLKDFGKNETSIEQSISIDKAEIGIDRISAESPDGSYGAGSKILITLEFTKAAIFEENGQGKPSLTLNNGGTATCTDTFEIYDGKKVGKTKLTFEYIVAAEDKNGSLSLTQNTISSINSNGCIWKDANNEDTFLNGSETSILESLSKSGKILANRNIVVDTQYPKIKDVTCLSKDGAYSADKDLTFKIEFAESVNISNENSIILNISGLVHQSTSKVGSNTLLSKYKVDSKANAEKISISSVTANVKDITDVAENTGDTSITTYTKTFENIELDTTLPAAPSIIGITNNSVITDDNAKVQFTLGNVEPNATVKYSIDNDGTSWSDYTKPVDLVNNGEYEIKACQIDVAGNESAESSVYKVTIDRGAILKRISATTSNGTYKVGDTITGYLEFRKPVTLPSDAKVILNIGEGKDVLINNPTQESQTFNFKYTIEEGDLVEDLDVKKLSFTTVTLGGSEVSVDLPISSLASNKDIKILTGKPSVNSILITGEDANAKLVVTFDRNISKVSSGTITLTQDIDSFKIPTVLTTTEYNDLKAVIGAAIDTHYKPGVNGATKNDDNTLTPDTTTKYILNFETENDDSTVTKLFTGKSLHVVTIPIYSSAVSVSGSTLTVELTGEYKLPVKGASYAVVISKDSVQDSVGNKNAIDNTKTATAPGVEKPEIRIYKSPYKITWSDNDKPTTSSDVIMPETAVMKISCRTPNATIFYWKDEVHSPESYIDDVDYHNTKTTDPAVKAPSVKYEEIDVYDPIDETKTKTYKGIELGSSASSFDDLKGLKIPISAKAVIGDSIDNPSSDVVYEYAVRTVLKFKIGDKYQNHSSRGAEGNNEIDEIKEGEISLYMDQLKVWVFGGDASSGGNSTDTFPLSWSKPSNFKVMKLATPKTRPDTVMGDWYWITWDLSSPAYHAFACGDVPVPTDDQPAGPTVWFAGECFWTPLKENYILYPGETLRMMTCQYDKYDEGGRSAYFFRTKNKGTRELTDEEKSSNNS